MVISTNNTACTTRYQISAVAQFQVKAFSIYLFSFERHVNMKNNLE